MDMKNKVDVSSFLVFESIGDSEADCLDPAMAVINHAEDVVDDDDDDAESCSCDTSGFLLPSVKEHHSLKDRANVEDDEDEEEDGEVVEQQKEDHNVHEKWRGDRPIEVGKEKKPAVPVDSTKSMNEKEESKLFWEACLAS